MRHDQTIRALWRDLHLSGIDHDTIRTAHRAQTGGHSITGKLTTSKQKLTYIRALHALKNKETSV